MILLVLPRTAHYYTRQQAPFKRGFEEIFSTHASLIKSIIPGQLLLKTLKQLFFIRRLEKFNFITAPSLVMAGLSVYHKRKDRPRFEGFNRCLRCQPGV